MRFGSLHRMRAAGALAGTMGCLLHDNHAGPHKFSAPTGPRIRKPKIKGEDE